MCDNGSTAGESLRIYGESDLLLATFETGLPPDGTVFMGVVSALPITRIYYNEDAGGVDICIRHFYFGMLSD